MYCIRSIHTIAFLSSNAAVGFLNNANNLQMQCLACYFCPELTTVSCRTSCTQLVLRSFLFSRSSSAAIHPELSAIQQIADYEVCNCGHTLQAGRRAWFHLVSAAFFIFRFFNLIVVAFCRSYNYGWHASCRPGSSDWWTEPDQDNGISILIFPASAACRRHSLADTGTRCIFTDNTGSNFEPCRGRRVFRK